MEQAKIEMKTIKSKRVIPELLPEWEEKEHNIFKHSSKSYFYLPFKDVNAGDIIQIDCEYIESIRVVQGYYYLNIPLTFYDRNSSQGMFAKNQDNDDSKQNQQNIPFHERVKVSCRLFHSHSMGLAVMFIFVVSVCVCLCEMLYVIF